MWDLETLKCLNAEHVRVLRARRARCKRSLARVVAASESLSLDNPRDRAVLVKRIMEVL